ncbi:MAG: 1-acyl-sn-glycerol-3-phosphate acyltransferase [Sandaracinaceae bacterium]
MPHVEVRPPRPQPDRPSPPREEEPGPLSARRWLTERLVAQLHVDDRWSRQVRDAAADGVVIYVLRTVSIADFVALDRLTQRFGLPRIRFVNDLGLDAVSALGLGARTEGSLADVLSRGESALLFLRREGDGRRDRGRRAAPRPDEVDHLLDLVELQRTLGRPIRLVPQTLVWNLRPERRERGWRELLAGAAALPNVVPLPGPIRSLWRLVRGSGSGRLRSGEPFDVASLLREHPELSDPEAADAIRYGLLRRIERERRHVVGPARKSPARIRDELLRSPRLRRHIEADAGQRKERVVEVERYVERELEKLCARMDPSTFRMLATLLEPVFNRVFDGFVVDQEGLERIREAARRGPLILLPSHKSHVDYLILSFVLARGALSPPLIAAGDNLSFVPLGPVLRRAGAFFIKRSFRGRKLYAHLVDAYLRKVLVEGHNVEFFLEGGRSRTGKLLPPKLGLLSMVVDAGLKLPNVQLSFVPVSVGYERIVEERAYAHEQEGGEKEPESVQGLLRTSRVLRSRYGRIYVQFGEVATLPDLLDEATRGRDGGVPDARRLKPKERRALINHIAHRVTYEINRVTIVSPSALVATALLSHRRRGIRHEDLVARSAALLAHLHRAGARLGPSLLTSTPEGPLSAAEAPARLREDTLAETLQLFRDARYVETREQVHAVHENKRLELEYHKNSVLHFFVDAALVSAALSLPDAGELTEAVLRERVLTLSRLFKYEFMYRTDAPFEAILGETLDRMEAEGQIARPHPEREDGGPIFVVPGSLVPAYATLVRPFIEAYRLAVDALDALEDGDIKRRDWMRRTLARGRRMVLAGDLELVESLSKAKLDNAVRALHDLGFARADRETLSPGKRLSDEAAVRELRDLLTRYLSS